MDNNFLDNTFVNISGGTTVILSIWMKSLEWLDIADINDLLIMLTSIGGLGFLILKIRSLSIDYKIKKYNFKKMLDEEEETKDT